MTLFALVLAAAISAGPAQHTEAPKERVVRYRHLPSDIRGDVVGILEEACAIDSRHAEEEAKAVSLLRADLDGDGNADYVLDEWLGPCAREPAHYVHVWMGIGNGHYHYNQRAEAELMRGPSGFAWIQERCNPRSNPDFQIEDYRRGAMSRSRCYPAAARAEELRRRGLASAYPK